MTNPERYVVEQLAECVGLPVDVVAGVLEAMLKDAKESKPAGEQSKPPQPQPPQHDDSLEVGLAAGLDVPTAMVLSEKDGCDWSCGEVLALLVVLVCLIYGLARLS